MADRITAQASHGRLILASSSPRRKELLEAAGFTFEVMHSSVEERQGQGESAEEFVRRIATEKAEEVLSRVTTTAPVSVLGADTVVVVNGQTLGKPISSDDARRMLRLLSGREHRVLTGVCLIHSSTPDPSSLRSLQKDVRVASTTVTIAPLSEPEIDQYVASGETADKAGGYAIQGRASKFVEKIEGCYFNVVGLPVSLVYQMFQQMETAHRETPDRR